MGLHEMSVTALKAEENRITSAIREAKERVAGLRKQLDHVQSVIAKRQPAGFEPRVSDHAVLRYIERTKGYDVEAVRREILTPEVCAALRAGASAYTVNGVSFKAHNGTLTTVIV